MPSGDYILKILSLVVVLVVHGATMYNHFNTKIDDIDDKLSAKITQLEKKNITIESTQEHHSTRLDVVTYDAKEMKMELKGLPKLSSENFRRTISLSRDLDYITSNDSQ